MKTLCTLILALFFFSSCQKVDLAKESASLNSTENINASTSSLEAKVPPTPLTTICGKVWMAKNLEVSSYRNGDKILKVTSPGEWKNLTVGAWCWYYNDSANFGYYGKLYNSYAVNDPRGLAPAGYHIPSEQELIDMQTCLGGETLAGAELKSTSGWIYNNFGYNGTNSTGFNGLPGGYRLDNAYFNAVNFIGNWWASKTAGSLYQKMFYLHQSNSYMKIVPADPGGGFNIRCIKD